MSAPHLHHSDKKFGGGGFREFKEIREFRGGEEVKDTANIVLSIIPESP